MTESRGRTDHKRVAASRRKTSVSSAYVAIGADDVSRCRLGPTGTTAKRSKSSPPLPEILRRNLSEFVAQIKPAWRIVLVNPPREEQAGKDALYMIRQCVTGEGGCELHGDGDDQWLVVARRDWGLVERDLNKLRESKRCGSDSAGPAVLDALSRYVIEEPKNLGQTSEAEKPEAGGGKESRRDEFRAACDASARREKEAASVVIARGSADGVDGFYACQSRASATSQEASPPLDPRLQRRLGSLLTKAKATTWIVLINAPRSGDGSQEFVEMVARLIQEGSASDTLDVSDGAERAAIAVTDWRDLNRHKEKLRARSKSARGARKPSVVDAFKAYRLAQPAALIVADSDLDELAAKKVRSSVDAATTWSQVGELTRVFEADRLKLVEEFVFEGRPPSRSRLRRFLTTYVGVPVSDEERRLLALAVRLICRRHQWRLAIQSEGESQPCLVEVVPSADGSGTRFRVRGVGKGQYHSASQFLPELEIL